MSAFTRISSFIICSGASSEKIASAVDDLGIEKSDNLNYVSPRNIKVTALQTSFGSCKNYADAAAAISEKIAGPVRAGAQLVALPDDIPRLFLSLLPGKTERSKGSVSAREYLSLSHTEQVFLQNTFSMVMFELAKAYGIYISAGSIPVREGNRVYRRMFLFDGIGRSVFVQDVFALSLEDISEGLSPAETFSAYDTRLGTIALISPKDLFFFETVSLFKEKGARLIIVPCVGNEDIPAFSQICRIRAQESGVFVVQSCSAALERTKAKSCICAPFMLTRDKKGILASAESFTEEGTASARLDMENLRDYFDLTCSGELDPGVHRLLIEKYKERSRDSV